MFTDLLVSQFKTRERIYKTNILLLCFSSSKNMIASFFAYYGLPWTDLKRLHSQKFKVDITGWVPDEQDVVRWRGGRGGHLKAGLTDAPRTTLCGRRSTGCNIASRLSLSVLTLTPLLLLLLLPVHSHTDADIWIAGEEIVQIWGWTKNMTRVTLFTLEEWSRWDFLC